MDHRNGDREHRPVHDRTPDPDLTSLDRLGPRIPAEGEGASDCGASDWGVDGGGSLALGMPSGLTLPPTLVRLCR